MKKILLSFLALGLFVAGFGQNDQKKRPTLAVHFLLDDFKTAASIRAGGLANVFKTHEWHKTGRMVAGMAVSYMEGLGSHLDFSTTLSGSFIDYPVPNKPATGTNNFLLEGVAGVNLKLLTDKYILNPYKS